MRVAIIGLGRMGTAIAERVLAAGHETVVANRSPGRAGSLVESGAREVEIADVWQHADVAITMVADSAALEDLAGILLEDAPSGRTLIDMSTVSAAASERVAAAADGVGYLRAPVSGNPIVVRNGMLGIVVSGPAEVFATHAALLRDIGPNVFHLGDGEGARWMKLALNLIIAGTAELLAEAIVLGEAHGLDRARMLEVMNGSAIASPFVKVKAGPLVADDYATTFTAELMRKDLAMALEGGVPLPVTGQVQDLLQATIDAGYGDLDFMALLLRLKDEASG